MNSFDKTLLPRKVILSGADCFHLVLDKHAKKHGAGGNVMRKIFYFSSSVSFEKVETILKSSPVIYWLCNIKLAQPPFFRLPYWKFTDKGNEIIVRKHQSLTENEIPASIINRDITVESERFIEADVIYYPSGSSAFVLSWNHILLDAKGTTLLFEHLNHLSENKAQQFDIFFPAKECKTNIVTYIRNMYKVKSFVQKSSRPPVSSVCTAKNKHGEDEIVNRTVIFNSEETSRIAANAIKTGSRFGPTLYFIACCSQVIHEINKRKNKAGDLWLPIPYDGRLKGAAGPLISNCVSFLFYRIPEEALDNVPKTVNCLANQMKSQIAGRIPQRYTMFLNMMRHIPLWLYYFLVSKTGRGVFASFLYTSTGDNFNELGSLFGESLRDLNMIPALTFPPGLTFVFLKHFNELNINIAYSPDVISDEELQIIEEKLKQTLLAQY